MQMSMQKNDIAQSSIVIAAIVLVVFVCWLYDKRIKKLEKQHAPQEKKSTLFLRKTTNDQTIDASFTRAACYA